jgi:O-antigen ligase
MLIIYLNFDSITELARRNDSKSNARDLSEHVESVSNIQTDASNMERINRWKCALRMFADKPIVGFGPGTYQYNYGLYQVRSEMTRISTVSGNRGHAHSEYLTYLSEMGLLGLIIFLAQLFFAVYTGMKIIYKSRDRFTQTLATGLLLALFTIYIHSIFNAFLDIDKMAMLAFGALAGLVMLDISYKKELSTTAGDSDISSNIERS